MGTKDDELLQDLYKALPPERPLEPGDPRYWPIYEDHRLVPSDPVEQLMRGIEWEDRVNIQILVGPPGCGKTTELLRLQQKLREESYTVVLGNDLTRLVEEASEVREDELRVLIFDQDEETLDTLEIEILHAEVNAVLPAESTYVVVSANGLNRNLDWTHPQVLDEPRRAEPLDTAHMEAVFAHLTKYLDTRIGGWRGLLNNRQLEEIITCSGGRIGTIFEILRLVARDARGLPAGDFVVHQAIAKAKRKLQSGLDPITQQDLNKLMSLWENGIVHQSLEDTFRRSQLLGGLLFRQQRGFYVNPLLQGPEEVTWDVEAPSIEHDTAAPEAADVHLHHVRIENVRAFDDFHVDYHVPENGSGQWTLLLGDNGVGKTTILRSLVLALSGHRTADALLQLQGASAPFLRTDSDSGSIDVKLDAGSFHVTLSRDARGIETLDGDSGDVFPVYAYGCQRGTALGGPNHVVDLTRPIDDVRTLFDPTAHMVHAESWLKELQRVAQQSDGGPEETFFESVLQTVAGSLEGVDQVGVDKTGVWLHGTNVGHTPLAALSDAYVTTAGWLLDLIARWTERSRRLGGVVDGDFREAMTGLVLLDEIDLHLHPLWQVRVIDDLRRLFPRLSFVATTHNPLTLLGAREGEVHVLRKDADGRVVANQRDIPPGARADQVLTGDWFGLASTLPPGTVEKLDEHQDMLRRQVPRDDEQRRKLEEELRERLGSFADTSLERMVRGIMAELMPKDFKERSPEQRRAVRGRILEEARRRKETA